MTKPPPQFVGMDQVQVQPAKLTDPGMTVFSFLLPSAVRTGSRAEACQIGQKFLLRHYVFRIQVHGDLGFVLAGLRCKMQRDAPMSRSGVALEIPWRWESDHRGSGLVETWME